MSYKEIDVVCNYNYSIKNALGLHGSLPGQAVTPSLAPGGMTALSFDWEAGVVIARKTGESPLQITDVG